MNDDVFVYYTTNVIFSGINPVEYCGDYPMRMAPLQKSGMKPRIHGCGIKSQSHLLVLALGFCSVFGLIGIPAPKQMSSHITSQYITQQLHKISHS